MPSIGVTSASEPSLLGSSLSRAPYGPRDSPSKLLTRSVTPCMLAARLAMAASSSACMSLSAGLVGDFDRGFADARLPPAGVGAATSAFDGALLASPATTSAYAGAGAGVLPAEALLGEIGFPPFPTSENPSSPAVDADTPASSLDIAT